MNREILRLAIPNILSNISVPLLSTVDTALMGRLSELHIGAVGLGAMIFNFVYWNFGFLRMGTTGLTAQAYGKHDEQNIILTLGRAMVVAILLAVLVILLQFPLAHLSFTLLNVHTDQLPLVQTYFGIRIWAAPATLALYALLGWFFGMQNAIYPLVLTIVINVVNIVCSYLFIVKWGMEVDGVAWGTVVAQYIGVLLALGLFAYRYGTLLRKLRWQLLQQWEALSRFLQLNADIFLRTFCLTFAFGFFYSQSSNSGDLILAANVILLQYLNWMSYGVDGFAFASESLVGKYAGAANEQKTRRAIRLCFWWGMTLAALFSLVYGLGGDAILQVYTDQTDVIAAARPFLFWMVLFPLLSTPCYLWDGIFIGLTAARAMRNSMLLALLVYVLSWYIFRTLGNHGLWLALLLFMIFRALFQFYLFRKRGMQLK